MLICGALFLTLSGTEVRLAWLETHAERTPLSGTSTTAAIAAAAASAGGGSEPEADEEAVAHDRTVDGGIPAKGNLASELEVGGQERPAGTSPTLAWASLGEEQGNSAGGGKVMDEEVEQLWRRMHRVENRIYQSLDGERRQVWSSS